jgi:CheY-like chemotaxis protein
MGVSTKKGLVLYADDDDDDIDSFRRALDKFEGYELRSFPNGLELLNYLQQEGSNADVCLIVLDINMYIMGGITALVKLKADDKLKDIPVVLFSTAKNPMDIIMATSLQTDILQKPRTEQAMVECMENMLERCSVRRAS